MWACDKAGSLHARLDIALFGTTLGGEGIAARQGCDVGCVS